ncbi:MAG TPA: hypothetical protein VFL14_16860 [Xanthomonadales bacterium]|nr:hypothetical protein [Xanthomonadales bacterium]
MLDVFTTVYVVAPIAGAAGEQWLVTRNGRVLQRCTARHEAWRAALGPAHDASVLHDEPALVLERDERGRVIRHVELGSPARWSNRDV